MKPLKKISRPHPFWADGETGGAAGGTTDGVTGGGDQAE